MGLLGSILGGIVSGYFDPSDYDWWCDDCDASLNNQPGFSPDCGSWICTECGCLNFIDEDNVRDEDSEPVYYEDSEFDDSERINVWDAADIWASNGKDEDYMFGYSEEELEDAL